MGKPSCAQKQANHWFDGQTHIDFNYNPPRSERIDFPFNGAAFYASISNQDGKLLFVSDGENVYDKNLAVMPNGTTGVDYDGSFPVVAPTLIVPQPNSSKHYVFMPLYHYSAPLKYSGFSLNYCIVNMVMNNGLGDVIEYGRSLPLSENDRFVATGNCEKFWLLTYPADPGNSDFDRNYILKYKIDENGLDINPDSIVINSAKGIWQLKFSPNSKYLAFISYDNTGSGGYKVFLYDFDGTTGKVFNQRILNIAESPWDDFEFSPNGRFMYLSKNSGGGYVNLYQYDISFENISDVEKSSVLLHIGIPELCIQKKALSPNGMIYCEQISSITNSGKSAVIELPNESGKKCSLKIDASNFFFFSGPPNFVSTFLSPQFDENFDISAGESVETCSNSLIDLGGPPTYDIEYSWLPTKCLSNPKAGNPTFLYSDAISVKTDFQYILDAQKGYCHHTDTVTVTVYPDLQTSVFGSKSVCPRVTEVDYWTREDNRFRFEWSIVGGDLVSGQHRDSITVDWGATNPAASVTLTPYNTLNCPSDPITFQVRINVELQTETPVGDELLCSNLVANIPYHITNTNGSVYTWESDFGNIISGQGTNKIDVDWPGNGKYHLWVKEQSTTIDTVCYGVSDSLLVNLFTDSTKIEIDYAGVMRENSDKYELQWYASDTSRLADNIEIFTSFDYSPNWQLKQVVDRQTTYHSFTDTAMNYAPVSFKISSVNGCREYIESEVHTAIFLEGIADSSSNSMNISWTPYQGWDNQIKQYEVWYSKDDDAQMSLVASMKPGQNSWSNHWGAEAFNHQYRIRAIHNTYPFESWSNEIALTFDHTIEIPNVFTPNGDGINDSFSFPKLELFHENELLVYDRYGSEVYSKQNYDGNWVGGDLASGVYYYSFTEKRNQKTYKGWVQILK